MQSHRSPPRRPSAPVLFLIVAANGALASLLLVALLYVPACGPLDTVPAASTPTTGDASYGGILVEDDAPADSPAAIVVMTPVSDDAGGGTGQPRAVAAVAQDAQAPPSIDAAPDGACAQPLLPSDLEIDELMIASVAGAGDYGQWIEVRNTRTCAVNALGLHGECAKGAKVNTFDVTQTMWLDPDASFVVADSSDPVVNHYLPGNVIVWFAEPGDVLRKEGATITLTVGTTIIDSVTYPDFKGPVGTSLAFPSDCMPSQRSDWTTWQLSTASWFPGFFGTPNAPNDDVSCPVAP